jgi:catechol 2,3-dioxygenase-like lactoylglutathione lyase family enzyme
MQAEYWTRLIATAIAPGRTRIASPAIDAGCRARSCPSLLVAATLALLVCTVAIASPPPAARVSAVDSVGITVDDMDRAIDFYTHVLTFEKVSEREVSGEDYEHLFGVFAMRLHVVRMRLGDESIELMQFLAPRGRPAPADSKSNDRWFQHVAIIVSNMDEAYARLRSFKVEHASSGPQRLPDSNPNAGGIKAFYFRDPDGNHLEILEFPADKGDPKWHRSSPRLFMGIDHTAIVVGDTAASLRFYRDSLGMRVAGTSENYGTEQEHLNNVFGAHLAITALRAPRGLGIELLEYLAPRGGRPIPSDTQANDDWYWQINLRTADPAAIAKASGVTHVTDGALGFQSGVVLKDPDGHASLLATER